MLIGPTIDRRSFSGYAFTYGQGVVSWECRKQMSVALSSTKAEYMALSEAAKKSVHLTGFLNEILEKKETIQLYDVFNYNICRSIQ